MPKMHKLIRNEIEEYKYDNVSGEWIFGKMSFEEFFERSFAGNGFYELFNSIVLKFGGYNFNTMPEDLRLPGRRWHAFCATNVILDSKVNKNDTVKFIGYNGSIETGTCLTGTLDNCTSSNRILVSVNRNPDNPIFVPERQWTSLNDILELNGEEYKLSYHIKWKRNIYGAKNMSKS